MPAIMVPAAVSFPQHGLAPVAQRQLAAWQAIAQTWPLTLDAQEGHLRCAHCQQSVARLADDQGRPYSYRPAEWLGMLVAHMRQAHPGADPDR